MKRFLYVMLVASLLVLPAVQVLAQYGDDPSPKLGFKIGVFSPAGSDFDGKLKSTWRCLGAEYSLSADALDRPTTLISGTAVSSDSDLAKVSSLGLLYEKRWYASQKEGGSVYYGAGAGTYLLKAQMRDFMWEGMTESSGMALGFTAVTGYQFKEAYYGELRYSMPGKLDGLDFSGLSATFGLRMEF